jgi:hypothetical protein
MSEGLLGITPTGVGASTVNIAPPSSGLASASGTVWTERGAVSTDWQQAPSGPSAGEDTMTVTVPDNVKATVSLPAGAVPYTAQGQGDAQYQGTASGVATFTVGSGTTTFTATAMAPTAPTGLTTTAATSQINLTWNAPANTGGTAVTGYQVFRGTNPGGEGAVAIASPTSTSYTDTAATAGTTYYYTVKAVNSVGNSPASNEASAEIATTSPPTPTCTTRGGNPHLAKPAGMSVIDGTCGQGYYIVSATGLVDTFGGAQFYGQLSTTPPAPIISITATADGGGYWLVDTAGHVYAFGDAGYYGGAGTLQLNAPIVGMASTADGKGYWLLASDGGVFSFGDAKFFGSTGNLTLNAPVVGIAVAPGGNGYWLVASDGGVFTFTDDGFYGSLGNVKLNRPVIGMSGTPDGRGYTLVGSDGGVFSFGDAPFYGSLGANPPTGGIASLATTPSGNGYYLLGAASGAVYAFGPGTTYLGGAA